MLVEFAKNTPKPEIDEVVELLDAAGCRVRSMHCYGHPVLRAVSGHINGQMRELQSNSFVERIIEASTPWELVSRDYHPNDTVVHVGDVRIGDPEQGLMMIAGPCSVESEEQILSAARTVKAHGAKILRGGAFKPRTSPYSFQGLEEQGLALLRKAGDEVGLPIVTEVLDSSDVDMVASYADMLQVGSRNMQNFKLLKAVGRSGKPVMLKRGMSAQLSEFLLSAEYILSEGNSEVVLCERGIRTFADYTRNMLDLNIVPLIRQTSHLPVIVDPSHGSGDRSLIEPLCMAGLSVGAQGVMVEVHPDPERSWSDGDQTIDAESFAGLMHKLQNFAGWLHAESLSTSTS